MQNNDFSSLLKGVQALTNAVSKRMGSGSDSRKVIGKNGKEVTTQIKEWYGVTMSVNGEYTFNYAAAGFTEILHVDPKAVYDGLGFNDQVIATINEVSTTSVRGKVLKGASQIFKGDAFIQGPTTLVMVKVIGT